MLVTQKPKSSPAMIEWHQDDCNFGVMTIYRLHNETLIFKFGFNKRIRILEKCGRIETRSWISKLGLCQ